VAFRNADDKLDATRHLQLMIKPLQMRMHGVGRNPELLGDYLLGLVIKQTLHNLQFTFGEGESLTNARPHGRTEKSST
jgi:hypothetical protein